MAPQEVLLENLPMIERIVAAICRQRHMSVDETEEFSCEVKLRLLENDYAILRRFQGRSSFRTYIAAVVVQMLRDYRARQYGKWRASAEAVRLGDAAVQLERLLYREHWSLEEAIPEMERRFRGMSRAECEEITSRLPWRFSRRHINIDDVDLPQEPDVLEFERAREAREISVVVRNYLDSLPDEDRLLFRLRFESGMPVSSIARSLHADMQSLYRRLSRLCADLRKVLEANGISAADAKALVGSDTAILDFDLSNLKRPAEATHNGIPAVERGKS